MPASTNRSVERAMAVLSLVCDTPNLSLTDVAVRTGLPASTALRILRTLQDDRYLTRGDDGLFTPGPQMMWMGGRVLANDSLRRVCRPGMLELAARTGESIYLSVRHDQHAMYIEAVQGELGFEDPSWEGREVPLDTTAVGRCLTGTLDGHPAAVVVSGVERDVTAIAAPVDLGDRPVAALSMVLPTARLVAAGADAHARRVVDAARTMSRLLGDDPPYRRTSRSIEAARRRAGAA